MAQDLVRQQVALEGLKQRLDEFARNLEENLKRYKESVEQLHGDGLSEQHYRNYLSNYYSRDETTINSLIRQLEDVDKKWVLNSLGANKDDIDVAMKDLGID